MNASIRYRPLIRRRRIQFNQALKLTRLSGCLLGGPGFGEDHAMQRPCPSSAVQLSAGVGPFHNRGAITLDNIIALRYGFRG
jgi:hypothetical protein